jgi:hypothetical protein
MSVRALFVDSQNGVVNPFDLEKFEDLYNLIDTDVIEFTRSYWQGENKIEIVLCDENGRLRIPKDGLFRGVGHKLMSFETNPPIVGKFVIVGYDVKKEQFANTELTPHSVGPLMVFYAWRTN